MTVVCGTDFSDCSERAASVAAAMAKRLELPLVLTHVVQAPVSDKKSDLYDDVRARLDAQVRRLGPEENGRIEGRVLVGPPEEALVALAASLDARLVVVGSLGARKQHRWLLGSVAERVAQSSTVPVLIVRNGERLERWARGGGMALRVMVGVEPTPGSLAALRWASRLSAVGPCEIIVAQIVWPAAPQYRIDPQAPIPLDRLRPDLEETLVQDLRRWANGAVDADTSYVVKPGWGRVDSHLTTLASESAVDLLVVGSHHRSGAARLWQGSVSRATLHCASMSVACVPSSKPVD